MKVNHKNLILSTFLLIIIEILIVIILVIFLGIYFTDKNLAHLEFIDKIITLTAGSIGLFLYGLIAKLLFEFIPKYLIQYFLVKIYSDKLRMLIVWNTLFLFGIIVSLSWWSDANFKLVYNLNTSVAIYNLFAICLSPFILKYFGWNIVENATKNNSTRKKA